MITYREILRLSIPIMVGSAAQNLIALTDTIFLGRAGDIESRSINLGAIGLVGVFYLMITSIGYSFSKAGQIMIARRMGEQRYDEIGTITYSMWAFAITVATVLFLFMKFAGPWFFGLIVDNPKILQACIEYLDYRAYGIFFSYTGVIAIAYYTGIAQARVILYNAVMLLIGNTLFNYVLIFGHWGFPAMGIAGAALASTLAEILAILVFFIAVLRDKATSRKYGIIPLLRNIDGSRPASKISLPIIKQQIILSTPIILQSVVGIGSWFIFFLFIEEMDTTGEALAISNVMRTVYLVLMIPTWGFGSGINTIVSNFIGKGQPKGVLTSINKTAILCFAVTMAISSSLLLAPNYVLAIATDEMHLIEASKRLIWVLLVILAIFSVSAIFFNGMIGTGATKQSLVLQTVGVIAYLLFVYLVVKQFKLEPALEWAWMGELVYWGLTMVMSFWYIKSARWQAIKV